MEEMKPMDKQRALNRQFYRRQEVLAYPDVIHVKEDRLRSDVVCFKHFGSAYMECLPKAATAEDDFTTVQYIRPEQFAKAWRERIYDVIDRLKEDQKIMFRDFPHEYDGNSVSKIIEGIYIASGHMISLLSELERTGCIRPYDKQREEKEQMERVKKLQSQKRQ